MYNNSACVDIQEEDDEEELFISTVVGSTENLLSESSESRKSTISKVASQISQLASRSSTRIRTAIARFKSFLSKIKLWIALVVYSVLGALIFMWLEVDNDVESKRIAYDDHDLARRIFLFEIQKVDWKELHSVQSAKNVIERFEINLGLKVPVANPQSDWTFWMALFYAATVYTTIGYGNVSCATTAGQLATILYAIVGIPLMLVLLNDLGCVILDYLKRFSKKSDHLIRYFGRRIARAVKPHPKKASEAKRRNSRVNFDAGTNSVLVAIDVEASAANEDNDADEEDSPPLLTALLLTLAVVFGSAFFFCLSEDWNFFTAVYFTFISLSTIGFGDVSPERPAAFFAMFALVVVGLALVSVCINVVQEQIAIVYRRIVEKMLTDYETELRKANGDVATARRKTAKTFQARSKFMMPLVSRSANAQVMQKVKKKAEAQGIELPSLLTDLDERTGLPALLSVLSDDRINEEVADPVLQSVKLPPRHITVTTETQCQSDAAVSDGWTQTRKCRILAPHENQADVSIQVRRKTRAVGNQTKIAGIYQAAASEPPAVEQRQALRGAVDRCFALRPFTRSGSHGHLDRLPEAPSALRSRSKSIDLLEIPLERSFFHQTLPETLQRAKDAILTFAHLRKKKRRRKRRTSASESPEFLSTDDLLCSSHYSSFDDILDAGVRYTGSSKVQTEADWVTSSFTQTHSEFLFFSAQSQTETLLETTNVGVAVDRSETAVQVDAPIPPRADSSSQTAAARVEMTDSYTLTDVTGKDDKNLQIQPDMKSTRSGTTAKFSDASTCTEALENEKREEASGASCQIRQESQTERAVQTLQTISKVAKFDASTNTLSAETKSRGTRTKKAPSGTTKEIQASIEMLDECVESRVQVAEVGANTETTISSLNTKSDTKDANVCEHLKRVNASVGEAVRSADKTTNTTKKKKTAKNAAENAEKSTETERASLRLQDAISQTETTEERTQTSSFVDSMTYLRGVIDQMVDRRRESVLTQSSQVGVLGRLSPSFFATGPLSPQSAERNQHLSEEILREIERRNAENRSE